MSFNRSPSSSLSPSPSPKQNKTILQRQYREKEGETFQLLREAIKDLTGEDLGTRTEILSKATQLLRALGAENRHPRQQDTPNRSGLSPPLSSPRSPRPGSSSEMVGNSHETTLTQLDYPIPPSQWNWLGNCEYDPLGFPPAHSATHQNGMSWYDPVPDMGSSTGGNAAPMPEIDLLCQSIGEQPVNQYTQASGSRGDYY
ncbi:hypothetical protein HYDPIDRAFT_112900 [Hydnomerulius pinastri MD-312]|uniref:BHLH domain-containing protein n=1 Tax=Hydnomerulius pinastri MD-312 TaxID=994086 RepID=A0A0C9WDZ5_9AGAM|nr:hypothetical protein HYDPIDRAFT_112900 [Hydnomerulius pinastri MD-312]